MLADICQGSCEFNL